MTNYDRIVPVIRWRWRLILPLVGLGLALLALAGCTTATVELPDGTHVAFTRFATDAALRLGPDTIDYSSSPSAAAQQQMTDTLVRALGLLATAGGLPPLPARLMSPAPPITREM